MVLTEHRLWFIPELLQLLQERMTMQKISPALHFTRILSRVGTSEHMHLFISIFPFSHNSTHPAHCYVPFL